MIDVVVIGIGGVGFSVVVMVLDEGKEVIMFEKFVVIGGNIICIGG